MTGSKRMLIAGGIISALVAVLHLILAGRPALYGIIAPGQMSSLSQMAQEGSSLTTILSLVVALIFALWAVYAFAGAGLLRSMPILRPALIIISVIYILRSLFLPTEVSMVVNEGYPAQFILYSTISLIAGLLYLIGILLKKRNRAI